jgi:hypothetical protein
LLIDPYLLLSLSLSRLLLSLFFGAGPYPANLMIGCFGRADASQPVRLDLDNELEDARWFTRQQILDILSDPDGTVIRRDEQGYFEVRLCFLFPLQLPFSSPHFNLGGEADACVFAPPHLLINLAGSRAERRACG